MNASYVVTVRSLAPDRHEITRVLIAALSAAIAARKIADRYPRGSVYVTVSKERIVS